MAVINNSDAVFAAAKSETVTVSVPEWGGEVLIRELSGSDRDKYETSMSTLDKNGKPKLTRQNSRARLVVLCAVTESGETLFDPRYVEKVGALPSRGLSRVFDACAELNGFSKRDVEDVVADFDDAPSASSTSV
ncbi:hypothetical protein [Streptomyces sp. NPDC055085]